MSVGKNLQEMENVVTKGAKPAEPMPKLTTGIPAGQSVGWEDLGGPTPENYKSDDDSAKLKTPGATLAQVRNVVNKGAKSADSMPHLAKGAVKEETEDEDELVDDTSYDEADYDEDDELVTEASDGDDEDDEDDENDDDDNDDDDNNGKKRKE